MASRAGGCASATMNIFLHLSSILAIFLSHALVSPYHQDARWEKQEGSNIASYPAATAAELRREFSPLTFNAGPKLYFDTISVAQIGGVCFNNLPLDLQGDVATLQILCPQTDDIPVQFDFSPANFCLGYEGHVPGKDSVCVKVCDEFSNCDTVTVCIYVIPGIVVIDTIFVGLDTGFYCYDPSIMPGDISAHADLCPEYHGDNVHFWFDENCVYYEGIAIGGDTACFQLLDDLGNIVVTTYYIHVIQSSPQEFCDEIFVGEKQVICLDTFEIPGNYAFIKEFCPDKRTGNVHLDISPVSLCIEYEGKSEGVDSACIIVCDDIGFCDTTYLCFSVKPYYEPPNLGDDLDTTLKNTPIVIDFLANDTLFGGKDTVYLIQLPGELNSGQAVLNLDNSITYIPSDPFCDRNDRFSYVGCSPNGCDTATVYIYIKCIELTVFSAISPNNDGVNDYFHIAKIEDFPVNQVWVYNRWGNLVYEKNGYRNDNPWPGAWGFDIELPDGTYYYILEWTDNDVTTVQRGFVEVYR
jgi:gliding motility-associated-like protein